MLKSLTNVQITNILRKNNIPFNGCYSKDLIPVNPKVGWYIINLQSSKDGDGSHWCAFRYDNICEWMDSFGVLPPTEIEKRCKGRQLIFNTREIQDWYSDACGWFCICTIAYDTNTDSITHYNRFLSRFSNNTKMNDKILYDLLKAKGILE